MSENPVVEQIETAALVAWQMEYALLAVFWIVWCAIHSGMISLTATGFLQRQLGTRYRSYRLFFNIFATATIIPIVAFERSVNGPVLFQWDGFLIGIQVILFVLAGLLFIAGAIHYDMLHFLGIRQITSGTSHSPLSETGKLNTTGILSLTRHPWYLGGILFVWTANRTLDTPTLVSNVVLTAYLVFGTILEERKLVVQFGDEYREYQKRVPMLLPVKWPMPFRR